MIEKTTNMKYLTNEALESIRVVNDGKRTAIFVYDTRGAVAALKWKFRNFMHDVDLRHRFGEKPPDDGYTLEQRYEALRQLLQNL